MSNETALIVDINSNFGPNIINKLIENDIKIYSAITSKNSTNKKDKKRDDQILYWEPRSSISSRNLISKSTENLSTNLNQVFIMISFLENTSSYHETSSLFMEKQVDLYLKGINFLLKEIIHQLIRQKSGSIYFILSTNGESEFLPPFYSSIYSSLYNLINSLMVFYQNESFQLLGFENTQEDINNFIDFVFKTIDEKKSQNTNKWNKFSGKGNILSAFSRSINKK